MRISLALAVALVALAAPAAAVAAPPKVTLTLSTLAPKVNQKVTWSVTATVGGKPAAGKLTAAIVDPLGTAHVIEFWANKNLVKNIAFKGRFADAVKFPVAARGYPLKFSVTVTIAGKRYTVFKTVTVK